MGWIDIKGRSESEMQMALSDFDPWTGPSLHTVGATTFLSLILVHNGAVFLWSKRTLVFSLLPELHHGAGEVPGVWDAVVGVAAVCVPGIATSLPWQILKIKGTKKREERGRKRKKKNHTDSSFYLDHSPTLGSHSFWLSSSQDHDTHLGHCDFMLFSQEWMLHRQMHLSIPCVRR